MRARAGMNSRSNIFFLLPSLVQSHHKVISHIQVDRRVCMFDTKSKICLKYGISMSETDDTGANEMKRLRRCTNGKQAVDFAVAVLELL